MSAFVLVRKWVNPKKSDKTGKVNHWVHYKVTVKIISTSTT